MEKQKILYVITKSNFGGASRYVYEMATLLPKKSYHVEVAVGGTGVLKDKIEEAGIPTHSIANFQRDISLSKECASVIELWRIMKSAKPDIVHLNSSKAGGIGAVVARLLGVKKIIFTAHGWPFYEKRNFLWRGLAWFFSWITALLCHKVILVSRHDYRRTHMPFVHTKLSVIHTAVPEIIFKERSIARNALFSEKDIALHAHDVWLVSSSEHNPNKNLLSALRAVEAHNAGSTQKIFFTLMSDGDERASLEKYVREHNLTDSITFTGYVEDARSYLKAFDIFILPSRKEGLPYGLLEAGAAALPCIASNVGGIPEIITHEKNGLLIAPSLTHSITEALATLVERPEVREKYGTALKEKVAQDFSLDTMFEKTHRLYEGTQ